MNLTIIFFLNLLLIVVTSVKFEIYLEPRSRKCFAETIFEETLVKGIIQTISDDRMNLVVRIYDDQWKFIKEHKNDSYVKFSLTSQKQGDCFTCIMNNSTKSGLIEIELKYGAEANDYIQLARKEQLAPIEVELRKMIDMVTQMKDYSSSIALLAESKLNEADTITLKLYLYSFLTIIITISLALYQMFYYKKFFKAKKLL